MLQRIKLISIFILICFVSYGQTSCLKNGFVAATDSGVFYLQDGFSEWVRLGNIKADFYDNRFKRDLDTVAAVSYYNNKIDVLAYGANVLTNDDVNFSNADFTTALYGGRLFSLRHDNDAAGSNELKTKSLNNKLKYNLGKLQLSDYSNSVLVQVWTSWYNTSGTFTIFFSNNVQKSNFSTDNDSVCVVVCGDNKLYTLDIEEGVEGASSRTTYSEITGLHSRSTDSHAITYNPDNDEFIIVSDSGIVYTYDKTTLSTIDTLTNCDSIIDIVYGGGFVYIYSLQQSSNTAKVFISSGLTNWISASGWTDDGLASIAIGYSDLDDNVFATWMQSSSRTVSCFYFYNDGTRTSTPYLPIPARTYDLDYINYLPE